MYKRQVDTLFNAAGVPRGAQVTNYLLEKSRIVFQSAGERGFHVFYQLIRGAPDAVRAKYHLEGGVEGFACLNLSGSNTFDVADVDDVEEFGATRQALATTAFGAREQDALFSLVAAVLHLGNVKFKEVDGSKAEACRVGGAGLAHAAELLGVDGDVLARVLSVRHIKTAREEYDVPNNRMQCGQTRDALAKALYARAFDWIVKRVNAAIAPPTNEEGEPGQELPFSIGVLGQQQRLHLRAIEHRHSRRVCRRHLIRVCCVALCVQTFTASRCSL